MKYAKLYPFDPADVNFDILAGKKRLTILPNLPDETASGARRFWLRLLELGYGQSTSCSTVSNIHPLLSQAGLHGPITLDRQDKEGGHSKMRLA